MKGIFILAICILAVSAYPADPGQGRQGGGQGGEGGDRRPEDAPARDPRPPNDNTLRDLISLLQTQSRDNAGLGDYRSEGDRRPQQGNDAGNPSQGRPAGDGNEGPERPPMDGQTTRELLSYLIARETMDAAQPASGSRGDGTSRPEGESERPSGDDRQGRPGAGGRGEGAGGRGPSEGEPRAPSNEQPLMENTGGLLARELLSYLLARDAANAQPNGNNPGGNNRERPQGEPDISGNDRQPPREP